ncbi:MAG: Gfo/Idh/MocA family oxidoreductase [Eubacteriales bacterium]|nr:Gfo/Idh/MocA family oxidoreductase [Eubacteriales bacterium]
MKLGIVGTGKIVHQALDALNDVQNIEVVSICSGPHNPHAAVQIAGQYRIPGVYSDYDQFLQDPENSAELIYIAVVNSAHYSYARKALEAGRHVFLEKPSVTSRAEWDDLAQIAREKDLYLSEALTPWHSEIFAKMQEILPALGPIHLVQCNYSQYSSRYDAYLKGEVLPAFDPALQGGSLMDLNVYNLSFLVGLFGSPDKMTYYPNRGFNGVDTSGTAVLQYPAFTATASAAKDSASPGFILIQGEKGWLRGLGSPNDLTSLEICLNGEVRSFIPQPCRHRMTPEFRDMARMITKDQKEEMLHLMECSGILVSVLEEGRKIL